MCGLVKVFVFKWSSFQCNIDCHKMSSGNLEESANKIPKENTQKKKRSDQIQKNQKENSKQGEEKKMKN